MTKGTRELLQSFLLTVVAVLVGGVITYLTIDAQARAQARTNQTTAAYAAYVEAATEFAHAVAERKHVPWTKQRMAAARGRIAIYGTPDVIEKLPVVGSIADDEVRKELVGAIEAMRRDVGEEPVDRKFLHRLVFSEER